MLVYVTHLTHLPTQEDFNELSNCERQKTLLSLTNTANIIIPTTHQLHKLVLKKELYPFQTICIQFPFLNLPLFYAWICWSVNYKVCISHLFHALSTPSTGNRYLTW